MNSNKENEIKIVSIGKASKMCYGREVPKDATHIVEYTANCWYPRNYAKMIDGVFHRMKSGTFDLNEIKIIVEIDQSENNIANALQETRFSLKGLTRNQREVLQDKLSAMGISPSVGYSGVEQEHGVYATIDYSLTVKSYSKDSVQYMLNKDFPEINIEDYFDPKTLIPVPVEMDGEKFSTEFKGKSLDVVNASLELLKRVEESGDQLMYESLTGELYLASTKCKITYYKWRKISNENDKYGFCETKWQGGRLSNLKLVAFTENDLAPYFLLLKQKLVDSLVNHLDICPFGYHNGQVITSRTTTDNDIINWLSVMKEKMQLVKS